MIRPDVPRLKSLPGQNTLRSHYRLLNSKETQVKYLGGGGGGGVTNPLPYLVCHSEGAWPPSRGVGVDSPSSERPPAAASSSERKIAETTKNTVRQRQTVANIVKGRLPKPWRKSTQPFRTSPKQLDRTRSLPQHPFIGGGLWARGCGWHKCKQRSFRATLTCTIHCNTWTLRWSETVT